MVNKLIIANSIKKTSDTIRVIITDSGIGGVGIAAELYRLLNENQSFIKAELIYFNALFDEMSGYNVLPEWNQKISHLDTAFQGMMRLQPDIILLASNTLSVLFPHSLFALKPTIPVIGLIEIGVDYIRESLEYSPKSQVIVFATPLTISESVFREKIIHFLPSERIIEHSCPGLEHAIGDGDYSKVLNLINRYVDEACLKLNFPDEGIIASLNCTHFGYYVGEFESALRRTTTKNVQLLNPNIRLAQTLVKDTAVKEGTTNLSIQFLSKVPFSKQGINSILPRLETISIQTANAFANYSLIPDLF